MVTIASFARAFVKVLASISTVSPTRLHRNPAQEPGCDQMRTLCIDLRPRAPQF